MNDILSGYTKEEIEELARKQLASNDIDEEKLKITKIDREYKKHNKKAVTRAIVNGSIILLFSSIIINSKSSLGSFGTNDLVDILNSVSQSLSFLPEHEVVIGVYSKTFEVLNPLIEKIGLMGIILANKSIKFIISSIKDAKVSLQMKKELQELKQQVDENINKTNLEENNNIK